LDSDFESDFESELESEEPDSAAGFFPFLPLEVHRDGVEDALDGAPALLTFGHGVVGHLLHDLERVPLLAAVFVERHPLDGTGRLRVLEVVEQ
jgi:hypothetical protein